MLCLSLLIVFVGNSSLNVALPTLPRELRRHRVAAPVGRRRLLARVRRPAVHHRRARRPLRAQGRAAVRASCIFLVGARPSRGVDGDVAAHRLPGGHGRRRRVHHAVDAVDPRERVPRRASGPRRSRSGPAITGAAGVFGPVASGWLLGHFWYGSVFLVNVPIIAHRPRRRAVPRAQVASDPEQERLDPVGAVLSIVGIVALVYGLIEAPESGLGERRRRSIAFVGAAICAHRVRRSGSCTSDEPMLDMRFFRTRRSAPAPAA